LLGPKTGIQRERFETLVVGGPTQKSEIRDKRGGVGGATYKLSGRLVVGRSKKNKCER